MTDQEFIVKLVGQKMGQLAISLAVVVTALRKQPGFDNEAFDALIKKELAGTDEDSTARDVYALILGEPIGGSTKS